MARQRPTLVLLHGGPGFDHTVFRPSYSWLADTEQVVYLDQRGHGRSDRGDPSRWTVDVWAEDVRGFCDVVGIEHPVMLGWSAGGAVAMAYAAGIRRRRLLPQRARPDLSSHPHRDLQQLRRRMAGNPAPGRAPGQLNPDPATGLPTPPVGSQSHRQIRASSASALPRSPAQIVRFGMASGSHLGDQVADHIGGSASVLCAVSDYVR